MYKDHRRRRIEKVLKKLVIAGVISSLLLGGPAYADPPEKTEAEVSTVTVTIDDVIAVAGELKDYDREADMLAQLVYSEARGIKSSMEQAAVCWAVLNRADKTGKSIKQIITAKHQFAYRRGLPVKPRYKALAKDVITRWLLEKRGVKYVGRVLPKGYIYFAGRDGHNRFRNKFKHGRYWNFDCENPYEK